jgi:hypothetical protein
MRKTDFLAGLFLGLLIGLIRGALFAMSAR